MCPFSPIVPPDGWPFVYPPCEPPVVRFWEGIPAFSWMLHQFRFQRIKSRFVTAVLLPAEQAIVTQLKARPLYNHWHESPRQSRIAEMMAFAVSEEKFIAPPSLHPDDRCDLLFWGAEDDLTPAIFAMAFAKHASRNLTLDEILSWNKPSVTVSNVIDYCLPRLVE